MTEKPFTKGKPHIVSYLVKRKSTLTILPHHPGGVSLVTGINESQLQRSRFLGPTRALKKTHASFTGTSE